MAAVSPAAKVLRRSGDAPSTQMSDNECVSEGECATTVIEYVCLARHRSEHLDEESFSVVVHKDRGAFCARGGHLSHEWVRVPATPLDQVTTASMEERPPAPRRV
jgi:hypothetical protein